jgi:thioredoxin reductase
MRPYYVAIVGAGPSGYFAAASLLRFADTSVAEGGRDVAFQILVRVQHLIAHVGLQRIFRDHDDVADARTF